MAATSLTTVKFPSTAHLLQVQSSPLLFISQHCYQRPRQNSASQTFSKPRHCFQNPLKCQVFLNLFNYSKTWTDPHKTDTQLMWMSSSPTWIHTILIPCTTFMELTTYLWNWPVINEYLINIYYRLQASFPFVTTYDKSCRIQHLASAISKAPWDEEYNKIKVIR